MKIAVHSQLPVYMNSRVQASVEGKSIDFNALEMLGISVSCIVGLSSLSPG